MPLYILAALAVVAGLANLPNTGALSWVPDSVALRFEHFYEPKGEYFTGVLGTFAHPEFSLALAVVSGVVGLAAVGAAYLWYFKGIGFHGVTERNRLARAGYRILEQKYYFDWLYVDVIVGTVKGPIARATNWFNQKVLDGVVNGAGASAVVGGRWVYDHIDQGLIDGAVNGAGTLAESSGQALRQTQTGRVQQYAALFFAAAALLVGLLIAFV